MVSAECLEKNIKGFLQLKYHKYIQNWLLTATANEKKGVQILSLILQHDGKRRFRARTSRMPSQNLDAVAMELRRNSMNSRYTEQYGSNIAKRTIDSDILRYRQITDLPSSSVLTKQATDVIKNWLKLDDDANYQTFIMATIRSLHSVVKI